MNAIEAFLASGIRFTTPILLAGLGCLATRWTRDLNVGLEGVMLFGAFFGVVCGYRFESAAVAIVLTSALGAVAGLVFGILVATLRANAFVVGTALNVLAAGATVYLLRTWFGVKGSFGDERIPSLPAARWGVIGDIPLIGPVLSGQSPLTYLSWLLVAGMAWAVRHTVIVRHLKASGEHPEALRAAGGNVMRTRIIAQVWCFTLCALAGVQLSLGQLTLFTEGMTSGLGFVALAAVIFCRGNVLLLAVMSVAFGFSSALSVRLNTSVMAPQFAQMLPYAVALVGLIVLSRRSRTADTRILTPSQEN
ncbi:ABC transporter permease [Streptomyces sp. NPDC059455]|uniref:ABC transporter permease n=1 Tax=Streptomyces sp. NPDC059455 TaxID=3346837 RepID=UPI0036784544